VNAKPKDESDFISNANIVKRLNALDTQHTLLIVDSCFSGSLVVRKRNAVPDEKFKSRRILASGRHETVSDGKKGENSPFAAGLLTLLRKNTAPKVDTTSVIRYVKDYVYGKAKQHPVDGRIQNSADEGGEFVFHLRKDEEAVWKEVSGAHTVDAYRDYLSGFPDGKYVTPAKRQIAALEEDEVWETARLNDNEEAYKDYIRAYTPNGKHLATAQQRLAGLQAELAKRKQIYDELAEKEQGREAMRDTYQALVNAAEHHFQARELDLARDKYREAIQAYVPGFVPEQRYLEEQYNLCRTSLDFLRIYEQGKTFMEEGNYRLAIEYFQQALKIKHVGKVEALVAECERQLASGTTKRTAFTTKKAPRNRKRATPVSKPKKRIGLWITVGAVAMFGIFLLIGSLMEDGGEEYLEPPMEVIDNAQNFKSDLGHQGDASSLTAPSLTIRERVLGAWQVDAVAMIINGVTYDLFEYMPALSYLRGTTYEFYTNGTVAENSALGYQVYNYTTSEAGGYLYCHSWLLRRHDRPAR
jgi:tetratricopeptide (TPR) repeat protein